MTLICVRLILACYIRVIRTLGINVESEITPPVGVLFEEAIFYRLVRPEMRKT